MALEWSRGGLGSQREYFVHANGKRRRGTGQGKFVCFDCKRSVSWPRPRQRPPSQPSPCSRSAEAEFKVREEKYVAFYCVWLGPGIATERMRNRRRL